MPCRGYLRHYELYGADDLYQPVKGSYLGDEFGSEYDVVLLSSMINQEGPDDNKDILKKSFKFMVNGGL